MDVFTDYLTGGTVLLHIRAQNCGIMMTKMDGSIQIKAFELSPLNESVITTLGRLRRSFPGPALSMNINNFQNLEFQAIIAKALAKMSHQRAPDTKPKVKKAKQYHDEDRNTTHPKIVTELFFNFLRPLCESAEPLRVWKNTREEVMWLNSRLPWHRSPCGCLFVLACNLPFQNNRYRTRRQTFRTNNSWSIY